MPTVVVHEPVAHPGRFGLWFADRPNFCDVPAAEDRVVVGVLDECILTPAVLDLEDPQGVVVADNEETVILDIGDHFEAGLQYRLTWSTLGLSGSAAKVSTWYRPR